MGRRKTVRLLALFCCWLALSAPASACTLWSAAGTAVDGGGTLLIKNRDWAPDHQQEMRRVTPEQGYSYWGLFAVGGRAPGLKAGLNERGLAIVSATAGVISRTAREQEPHTPGLTARLLRECASIDEVLAHPEWLRGVEYLMLADRSETAVIELAPGGQFAVRRNSSGSLTHTNHYLLDEFTALNAKIGDSSRLRGARIGELLESGKQPYTLDEFLAFSQDEHDGADNSILRRGSTPQTTRTLATFAVRVPPAGSPQLVVTLRNPGCEETTLRLTGKALFGKEKE